MAIYRKPRWFLIVIGLLIALQLIFYWLGTDLWVNSAHAALIYSQDFESFNTGDISGQDDWLGTGSISTISPMYGTKSLWGYGSRNFATSTFTDWSYLYFSFKYHHNDTQEIFAYRFPSTERAFDLYMPAASTSYNEFSITYSTSTKLYPPMLFLVDTTYDCSMEFNLSSYRLACDGVNGGAWSDLADYLPAEEGTASVNNFRFNSNQAGLAAANFDNLEFCNTGGCGGAAGNSSISLYTLLNSGATSTSPTSNFYWWGTDYNYQNELSTTTPPHIIVGYTFGGGSSSTNPYFQDKVWNLSTATGTAYNEYIGKSANLELGAWEAQAFLVSGGTDEADNWGAILAQSDIMNFTITGLGGGLPTSTASSTEWNFTCDSASGFWSNSLCWFFYKFIYPDPEAQEIFRTLFDNLGNDIQAKPPIGYFIQGRDIFVSALSTTTSGEYALITASDTAQIAPITSPIRNGFKWTLCLFASFWIIRRITIWDFS